MNEDKLDEIREDARREKAEARRPKECQRCDKELVYNELFCDECNDILCEEEELAIAEAEEREYAKILDKEHRDSGDFDYSMNG